ncbi:MAG: hypothetical protein IPG66_02080 [Hydrogenophilales bacterium]|nr:hypothetical protein [Hydrogenophilales bacterium]
MVNEISGIGLSSAAQGLGQASASQPGTVRGSVDVSLPGEQNSRVETQHSSFSGLAAAKDEAAHVAQSVREVGKALEQADRLVKALSQEVQMVKNYPPFPPGNEQRLAFINSVNGLRQQLEALAIPPIEPGVEPVFYPREAELPELFPATSSDEDVAAFSAKLGDVGVRLGQGFEALQAVAAKAQSTTNSELPSVAFDDSEIQALGIAVGRQLGDANQPMLSRDTALGYL